MVAWLSVVIAAVYATANVSGGHLNPAVTFATIFSGHIGPAAGIAYIIAQLSGASLGILLLVSCSATGALEFSQQCHKPIDTAQAVSCTVCSVTNIVSVHPYMLTPKKLLGAPYDVHVTPKSTCGMQIGLLPGLEVGQGDGALGCFAPAAGITRVSVLREPER